MAKPVQVSNAKFTFDCPDCGKSVNFQEAYKEEPLDNKGTERIAIVCPYCDSLEVSYYSNNRIKKNLLRLRQIRESNLPGKVTEYYTLQEKHKKYFDKFNHKMKKLVGESI